MASTPANNRGLVLALHALLVLACACHDAHEHAAGGDHDHDHDHEDAPLQATVWGERHELFIEHPPPVAGQALVFAIHVTDHRSTRPRREGELRLDFGAEDGRTLEHVEPAPARAGIYLAELRFPSAGHWYMYATIPGEDSDESITLPDLRVFASEHDAAHVSPPAEPEGVTFLKEQQWRLRTRIEAVEVRSVSEHLVLPARVLAAPERTARLAPPVAGVLVAVPGGEPLALGRRVEAGELLAYSRPPLSELGVKLIEAEAEVERTRLVREHTARLLERTAGLFEDQARSQRELEEAQFQHQSAEAAHAAARAVVHALRRTGLVLLDEEDDSGAALPLFELRAPISGTITEVLAAVGEHLGEERTLLELLDASVVHVEVSIRPAQLARVRSLEHLLLRRPRDGAGTAELLALPEPRPRLVTSELAVDAATQAIALRYELENGPHGARHLFVGAALEALLATGDPSPAPAVPLGALVDHEGQPTVYVQLTGEVFEQRHVRLGARDARWVQVLEGLAAGERVVTEGAYAVRLASASGSIPAHEH